MSSKLLKLSVCLYASKLSLRVCLGSTELRPMHACRLFGKVPGGVSGHSQSVKILLIQNPTGYMFTSSGFDAFIHLRYILM